MVRGVQPQIGHNDFAIRDGELLRYIFPVMKDVTTHSCVALGPHLYVRSIGARKQLLGETYVMEEVKISPIFVLVSHGYAQHASSEWRGENCTWYRSYLIPQIRDLPDAIDFAYRDSILQDSEETAVA